MVALLLLGVATAASPAYQDPLRYPYPANYPELPQGSDDLEEEYATSVAQENYRRGLELGETEDEARTDAKVAHDHAAQEWEKIEGAGQDYADRIAAQKIGELVSQGVPYKEAWKYGEEIREQALLEYENDVEREFAEESEEENKYAEGIAQREFEASIAAGKTYDEAVAAGRYKHARAEQAFEEAVAKQKAYADRVAQEAFEQAVAAGQPFDRAVAAGRAAHEDAEARFTAGQAALAAEAPAWKPQSATPGGAFRGGPRFAGPAGPTPAEPAQASATKLGFSAATFAAGVLAVGLLGGFVWVMERRRTRRAAAGQQPFLTPAP